MPFIHVEHVRKLALAVSTMLLTCNTAQYLIKIGSGSTEVQYPHLNNFEMPEQKYSCKNIALRAVEGDA